MTSPYPAPAAVLAEPEGRHLWFVFHSDEGGALAFDLTRPHPEIPYRGFTAVLDTEDLKDDGEKLVLLGGPVQPDDALIILHDAPDIDGSIRLNDDFSFLTYRYTLVPGKPPVLAGKDDRPSRLPFAGRTHFLVACGFRAWTPAQMADDIAGGALRVLPSSADLVFHTPHAMRYTRAMNILN